MARDYKRGKAKPKSTARKPAARKSKTRKGRRKKNTGFKWKRFFWFLLIAAALITVIYFYIGSPKRDKSNDKPLETPVAEVIPPKPDPEPEVTEAPKDEFTYDFYTRLPEAEVVISDQEYRKELKKVPVQESASGNTNDRYMIQVGAFKRSKDADSLKAELALLGFEARVQKVTTSDGQHWNRVRLGPYQTLQAVNKARTTLHSRQMKTQLVKLSD